MRARRQTRASIPMPPHLLRRSLSLTRGKIRERRSTLTPRTAKVAKTAMLKYLQVMSQLRQLHQSSHSAICSPPPLPAHPLMPISLCRSCRTMRHRAPVRLKSPIDKPSATRAPTRSAKCVAGRDFRNSARRAQRYGCGSLADQSERRSPLPLDATVAIRELAVCVFAKDEHRAGTQRHIF